MSYPSAVLPNRPKYRNEKNNNDDDGAVNIMHDKRVIRGNTYAVNQVRKGDQQLVTKLQGFIRSASTFD